MTDYDHEYFMKLAVKEALKNLKTLKGGPFGACITKDGEVLSVARNMVLTQDATSHAEINAIQLASKKIGHFDLSGCVVYSTTEPCPMCFSALHWAKVKKIYYGTSIVDAKKVGFNELSISNKRMKSLGGSKIELVPNFLKEECLQLFFLWEQLANKPIY